MDFHWVATLGGWITGIGLPLVCIDWAMDKCKLQVGTLGKQCKCK